MHAKSHTNRNSVNSVTQLWVQTPFSLIKADATLKKAFIHKIGKQPWNPNRQQSSINVQAADKQDQSMNGKNSTAMRLHSINGQLFLDTQF